MASLKRHVHVRDDSGVAHVFAPGDFVPEWACEKITNPNVWAVPPEAPSGDNRTGHGVAVIDLGVSRAEADLTESTDGEQQTQGDLVDARTDAADTLDALSAEVSAPRWPIPMRSGKGSGFAVWAAYAKANNVDCQGMTSRDDVIAALEAAGVPTEPATD